MSQQKQQIYKDQSRFSSDQQKIMKYYKNSSNLFVKFAVMSQPVPAARFAKNVW